jgi:hypothetical protein
VVFAAEGLSMLPFPTHRARLNKASIRRIRFCQGAPVDSRGEISDRGSVPGKCTIGTWALEIQRARRMMGVLEQSQSLSWLQAAWISVCCESSGLQH